MHLRGAEGATRVIHSPKLSPQFEFDSSLRVLASMTVPMNSTYFVPGAFVLGSFWIVTLALSEDLRERECRASLHASSPEPTATPLAHEAKETKTAIARTAHALGLDRDAVPGVLQLADQPDALAQEARHELGIDAGRADVLHVENRELWLLCAGAALLPSAPKHRDWEGGQAAGQADQRGMLC
jgi:hypothetical protein